MIFTVGEGKQEWAIETREPECEWDHMLTPLSKYKNQPFAVGSFLEYGQNTKKPNRAEMFDLTKRTVFNKTGWIQTYFRTKDRKSPFLDLLVTRILNRISENGFKCQNFLFIQIYTVLVRTEP